MASSELQPCPFHKPDASCPPVASEWYSGQRIAFWAVQCEACGARGPDHETRAEAVEAWNQCAPAPAGDECANQFHNHGHSPCVPVPAASGPDSRVGQTTPVSDGEREGKKGAI